MIEIRESTANEKKIIEWLKKNNYIYKFLNIRKIP